MHGTATIDARPVAACSVPRRSFEGLLLSRPPPPLALRDALTQVGFDPDDPEHLYAYEVWTEALRVSRRMLFPELSPEEGFFALGRRFADGFGRTVVGRVFRSHTGSLLGPERTLVRLPSILAAGVKGLVVELQPMGVSSWRMCCFTRPEEADFFAGAVFGLLEDLELPGLSVRVHARHVTAFELDIEWDAPSLAS